MNDTNALMVFCAVVEIAPAGVVVPCRNVADASCRCCFCEYQCERERLRDSAFATERQRAVNSALVCTFAFTDRPSLALAFALALPSPAASAGGARPALGLEEHGPPGSLGGPRDPPLHARLWLDRLDLHSHDSIGQPLVLAELRNQRPCVERPDSAALHRTLLSHDRVLSRGYTPPELGPLGGI